MSEVNSTSSFRVYLQTVLARRCASNAQYSLRSFALQLDVDHSTLSQLLRGKRALTERMIDKIGSRLGLTSAEIEAFATHEHLMKSVNSLVSSEVRQLTMDAACLLSDARHRAILELVQLDIFSPDTRWIARVLNLDVDEVNISVSRLLRLGLLEMVAHDRWVDKSGMAASDTDSFSRSVIRKLAEQVGKLSDPFPYDNDIGSQEFKPIKFLMRKKDISLIVEFSERLEGNLAGRAKESDAKEVFEVEINFNPTK